MKQFSFTTSPAADEEIRFRTKSLVTYNNLLIDENELKKHVSLSIPKMWNARRHGTKGISNGLFAALPLEIMYQIFAMTTVQSFMYLRATNSVFKHLAESWSPFLTAMTYGRSLVMALIATQSSQLWTFTDVETAMFRSTCECCGAHAEIVHLLKMRRVCFRCVSVDRRYMAVEATYACGTMLLHHSDLKRLPHLFTIRQKSTWGLGSLCVPRTCILDYGAAAELATTRWMERASNTKPSQPPVQSDYQIELVSSGCKLAPSYTRTKPYDRNSIPKPLHLRRKVRTVNKPNPLGPAEIYDIEPFIIDPPESSNIQHACCVRVPAYHRPDPSSKPEQVQALLCAGCSFYFNYHSSLPHQAQTLYAYTHPPQPAVSPLEHHLRTCPYAEVYSYNLRPLHLDPSPSNTFLTSNDGTLTPSSISRRARDRRSAILAPTSSRWRHFPRHEFDMTQIRRIPPSENNALFETMPDNLTHYLSTHTHLPTQTPLDLELSRKAALGDAWGKYTDLLDPTHDFSRFTRQTRSQLSRIRATNTRNARFRKLASLSRHPPVIKGEEWTDPDFTPDFYSDVVLGSQETVSQAGWATARPGSAMCLFRGWYRVLEERMGKEEKWAAEVKGREVRYEIGGGGWGFDRFGCVSGMG